MSPTVNAILRGKKCIIERKETQTHYLTIICQYLQWIGNMITDNNMILWSITPYATSCPSTSNLNLFGQKARPFCIKLYFSFSLTSKHLNLFLIRLPVSMYVIQSLVQRNEVCWAYIIISIYFSSLCWCNIQWHYWGCSISLIISYTSLWLCSTLLRTLWTSFGVIYFVT